MSMCISRLASQAGRPSPRSLISAGQEWSCGRGAAGGQCRQQFSPRKWEETPMDFNMSDRQREWLNRVESFMHKHVRPAVPIYKQQDEAGERWKVIPILEELKKKARAEGLWNMFMPPSAHEDDEFGGARLTNLD